MQVFMAWRIQLINKIFRILKTFCLQIQNIILHNFSVFCRSQIKTLSIIVISWLNTTFKIHMYYAGLCNLGMYTTLIWFRLVFHIIFLKSEPNLWIRKPTMEKRLVLHLCISIHQGNFYYIDSFPDRRYYGESWYIVYNTGQSFTLWRPFKKSSSWKTAIT